jgi:peptide chain release factor 1
MYDQLKPVERRFEEIDAQLTSAEIVSQRQVYTALLKERAELEPVVLAWRTHCQLEAELADARAMLAERDDAMRALAREELDSLEPKLQESERALRLLLIPKDPLDDKNIILEIRAGTGGDEAALFAGDLFNMYCRYADSLRWTVEPISLVQGAAGGYKEVIALIQGDRVYSHLRFEAGGHRVQRVPKTETQGRIHTSACTVAILPEAQEADIHIDERDLEIDRYRASGAGGQHVNMTDSAIRITHKPSGLVVTSQDERSQHKNKARALQVLRSRLLAAERDRLHSARDEARRSMIGSGDRSDRIRTYNFPQNRLSDHRVGVTLYSLENIVLTGDLADLIAALRADYQAKLLQHDPTQAS